MQIVHFMKRCRPTVFPWLENDANRSGESKTSKQFNQCLVNQFVLPLSFITETMLNTVKPISNAELSFVTLFLRILKNGKESKMDKTNGFVVDRRTEKTGLPSCHSLPSSYNSADLSGF